MVREFVPGLFAEGEDLPENDAKAPDIAFDGELAVEDGLRGHPADRQHCLPSHLSLCVREERRTGCTSYPIVVGGVDIARHAKVADLDDESFAHQAVACREVAMHEML